MKLTFRFFVCIYSLLIPGQTLSEQFIMYQGQISWNDPQRSQFYRTIDNPDSWNSPDYFHGNFYVRLKILEKPSSLPMKMQICFWHGSGKNEVCFSSSVDIDYIPFIDEGEVIWYSVEGVDRLKRIAGTAWTGQPITKVLYQMRAQKGSSYPEAKNCLERKCWGPGIEEHIPVSWESEGVVVAKGSSLDLNALNLDWEGCPWAKAGVSNTHKKVTTQGVNLYYDMVVLSTNQRTPQLEIKGRCHHSFRLVSLTGKVLSTVQGAGHKTYKLNRILPASFTAGSVIIEGKIDNQQFVKKNTIFRGNR